VGSFPKFSFHPGCQRNAGLSEFVAQAIRGREGLFPLLAPLALEQIALAQDFFKAGSMHSQQPHLSSLPPVLAEQASHLLEDLGIDLSRIRQRVRASDS